MLSIAAVTLVLCGITMAIFLPRERAANAQAAFERERARVAAAEREATLARLKMLEAQIEPHFLYNTLANAISLVDSDPAAAKRMLDRLISLLRAAADTDSAITLGRQAELVGAYLEILALRMGPRLAWSIQVAPDVAALPVAPMLLQPIVENAVKHGLEPKLDGGRIDIEARRDRSRLELVVTDTGLGFRTTPTVGSTGVGLRNLHARLAALYGAAATLAIEERSPCGTRVTLSIPLPGTS
jgi:sensor histidine kinase YesM